MKEIHTKEKPNPGDNGVLLKTTKPPKSVADLERTDSSSFTRATLQRRIRVQPKQLVPEK